MGQDFFEKYEACRRILECGSDICGFDLKKACLEGPEEALSKTSVSQAAIFAVSLAAHAAVTAEGITADACAGHSLGEYAAMTASGMVSLEDGFKLIKLRSATMQKCAESQKGAMFAIMNTPVAEIERICEEVSGYVVPVNYNSPVQTVIAGEEDAACAAAEIFASMKKRAIRLNVNAAFHSKLMAPAAEEVEAGCGSIQFRAPSMTFYSNLTGGVKEDFSDMPAYLAKHIVSPVRFTDELFAMNAAGYDHFIELGPKKVLTGLVAKTLKEAARNNVEDEASLNTLLEAEKK